MCFRTREKSSKSKISHVSHYGMPHFLMHFVLFGQFSTLNFGLAHSGSRPFNCLVILIIDSCVLSLAPSPYLNINIISSHIALLMWQFQHPLHVDCMCCKRFPNDVKTTVYIMFCRYWRDVLKWSHFSTCYSISVYTYHLLLKLRSCEI